MMARVKRSTVAFCFAVTALTVLAAPTMVLAQADCNVDQLPREAAGQGRLAVRIDGEWQSFAQNDDAPAHVLEIGRLQNLGGGRRRARIAAWLETELPSWFEDRVLPVDTGVADEWGRLMARLKKPVPAIDSLIAATALRHRFAIVTRNESDFAVTGVDLLNPWKD